MGTSPRPAGERVAAFAIHPPAPRFPSARSSEAAPSLGAPAAKASEPPIPARPSPAWPGPAAPHLRGAPSSGPPSCGSWEQPGPPSLRRPGRPPQPRLPAAAGRPSAQVLACPPDRLGSARLGSPGRACSPSLGTMAAAGAKEGCCLPGKVRSPCTMVLRESLVSRNLRGYKT